MIFDGDNPCHGFTELGHDEGFARARYLVEQRQAVPLERFRLNP
jgi:hypothetical protein